MQPLKFILEHVIIGNISTASFREKLKTKSFDYKKTVFSFFLHIPNITVSFLKELLPTSALVVACLNSNMISLFFAYTL